MVMVLVAVKVMVMVITTIKNGSFKIYYVLDFFGLCLISADLDRFTGLP